MCDSLNIHHGRGNEDRRFISGLLPSKAAIVNQDLVLCNQLHPNTSFEQTLSEKKADVLTMTV